MHIDLQKWKSQKEALGLTFDELAQISQVSRRTICNIFSGEIDNPRLDSIQRIERALGITQEEPTPTLTDEEKELFHLISQLTDEEVEELSKFVDFIISKRK